MTRALLAFSVLSLLPFASASLARAEDAVPAAIPPAWVEIARVEHARGDPAGLDPFLAATADAETRRRAIVALGRLGDRRGVAPRLRELLRRGGPDAPLALWAAGLSRAKDLVPDVLPWLEQDPKAKRDVVEAALEALGYLGDARADGFALPFLLAEDPRLRAKACLALMRLAAERDLESVAQLNLDVSDAVRSAAAASAWRLAAMRRKSLAVDGAPWDKALPLREWGKATPLVVRVAGREGTQDAEEAYLFGVRALVSVTPKALARSKAEPGLPDALLDVLTQKDPQIVADLAMRLGATKEGDDLDAALAGALAHASPLVREAVVTALGTRASPAAAKALRARVGVEEDARVRAAMAVALAASGEEEAANALLGGLEPAAQGLPRARLLLASKRKEAVADAVALARDPATSPRVRAELLDGLTKKDGPDLAALGRDFMKDPDAVVRAQAAALLAKKGGAGALADLLAVWREDAGRDDNDRKGAIVEALGAAATAKDASPERVKQAVDALRRALADPSPVVRLAARDAAKDVPALADLAKAEDPHPNEWRGLPRPKVPVLGLDLSKGDPWLSEEEILRLAAEIQRRDARVVFDTDQGVIRLALDPVNSPVHSVNLVLCAAAGIYDGTPWHRVVPAFVIQGGDPRGDGSGDAGYALPDEITPSPFVRGALGMPKSTKDTGGCQVFVMHCWAPHLDGNYTCFGRAVDGLDVVDRIREGDKIRTARVETAR